jgi:hypothetical protein
MTKELQFHLSEPDSLKVVTADYEERWLISHGYQQKTLREKVFAWMFSTPVVMLCDVYRVCALIMSRVAPCVTKAPGKYDRIEHQRSAIVSQNRTNRRWQT